jgi:hypothetical protein
VSEDVAQAIMITTDEKQAAFIIDGLNRRSLKTLCALSEASPFRESIECLVRGDLEQTA